MGQWVTAMMEQFGYLGIFLMMTLENLFPPIPSEIILPFGGFMTTYSALTYAGVLTAATLGALIGAMLLYCIGMIVDVNRLEKIVDKYGHILHLKKTDIYKADEWFEKYGYWTVFFCRMVPLLRSLISIPAGMARMNFGIFMLLTAAGSIIWNSILIGIGTVLGENWHRVAALMDVYSNVVYAFILLAIILFLIWYMKRRKKGKL
ncbi:DedA family protein [Oceanobacillus jeddahense]|uniref:DedA family protein n=1 Tax=Oceanobacillus jeddahense TaxID=1462527 RepID=A0ABY5JPE7_9BACI|nr:DedA family protein [Oceanobacillus jeddahense]UUI01996.1 DedA family protein [Oceanobacillus jeddahense]